MHSDQNSGLATTHNHPNYQSLIKPQGEFMPWINLCSQFFSDFKIEGFDVSKYHSTRKLIIECLMNLWKSNVKSICWMFKTKYGLQGCCKIFQFRKVINYDITEKFMNAQLMN